MRSRVRAAFAACLAGSSLAACGSGTTVAAQAPAAPAAAPVVDMACKSAVDDPLYYTARPTLVAAAPAGDKVVRMRFEVYEQDASEAPESEWKAIGFTPHAVGYGQAGTGRSRTHSWTPREPLAEGMHAWRARPETKGKPPGRWSRWHEITINTGMTRVQECRIDGAVLQDVVRHAELEGLPLGPKLDEAAFQERILAVFHEIEDLFPDDFVEAGLDNERRSGWIAFRGAIPDGAQALIEAYQAEGGSVEVREHQKREDT